MTRAGRKIKQSVSIESVYTRGGFLVAPHLYLKISLKTTLGWKRSLVASFYIDPLPLLRWCGGVRPGFRLGRGRKRLRTYSRKERGGIIQNCDCRMPSCVLNVKLCYTEWFIAGIMMIPRTPMTGKIEIKCGSHSAVCRVL